MIICKYATCLVCSDENQISNILYSDKNAFIWLPQLHIAGLLYSGIEPPICSKLLLPKLQYNLGSLMVSLDLSVDQGHAIQCNSCNVLKLKSGMESCRKLGLGNCSLESLNKLKQHQLHVSCNVQGGRHKMLIYNHFGLMSTECTVFFWPGSLLGSPA